MQFHERLKKYRKRKGLTQEELAQKIHVSRSAVAKWENGLGLPSDDSLDAIAAFFEVKRDELLADRETASIIVEKNGKLSRQKMCLIGLIVLASVLFVVSSIILAVFLTRGNNKLGGGQGNIVDEEDVAAEGINKTDVYTWFDSAKTDLPSSEMCQEITKGMSLNQVIKKLGKPQREIGYGAVLLQFDLDDGSILTITFVDDVEKRKDKPNLTTYDYLMVYLLDFDQGIPDVYFPYSGSLNDLCAWIGELNAEEIAKVRFEHAFIGVAPGQLKDISYSTSRTDIQAAYRLLFSSLKAISNTEAQVSGGSYVKYDFFTANHETYSVTVSNNTVLINHQYYKFDDRFYYEFAHSDLDCHSFITYDIPACEAYEIYTYANESVKIGDYDGLGEFEFCVYEGVIESAPSLYLRSSIGVNLLILSGNQFMIEHENNTIVYRITGKKDFSALFAQTHE